MKGINLKINTAMQRKFNFVLVLFFILSTHLFAQNQNSKRQRGLREMGLSVYNNLDGGEKVHKQSALQPQCTKQIAPRPQPTDVSRFNTPDAALPLAPDRAQIDLSVTINPTDVNHVRIASTIFETENYIPVYYKGVAVFSSTDGGQTWEGENESIGPASYGYPGIVSNPSGKAFLSFKDIDKGQSIAIENNFGNGWVFKKIENPPNGVLGQLRESNLWMDNSAVSGYTGNLYNSWRQSGSLYNNESIFVSRSSTSGLTWSPGNCISSEIGMNADNKWPVVQTGPEGQVYVVWIMEEVWDCDENALGFNCSTNGGVSWQSSRRIFDNIRALNSTQPKSYDIKSTPAMACDISEGPFRGNLYVVWANVGYPGENFGEKPDIYMIKSQDEGQTWEEPVMINTDPVPGESSQYMPWITCDPTNGVLHVIYYDDRNCDATQAEAWVASSYDGGQSWIEGVVSDEPFDVNGFAPDINYMAQRIGIAANQGRVFPAWVEKMGQQTVTKVSPFQSNDLAWPLFTNFEINQQTGQVNMQWQVIDNKSLNHFNIYRNDELILTTTALNYSEQLPFPGTFIYKVTAQHPTGESASTAHSVTWGSALLDAFPSYFSLVAPADTTFNRRIQIKNVGLLDLNYKIHPQILSDNSGTEYCIPLCDGGLYIRNVKFGDIDNYSFWDGYGDFVNQNTKISAGSVDTLIYQVKNWWVGWEEIYSWLWVDWNKNGEFEEIEKVEASLFDEFHQLFRAVIQSPDTLEPGNYRLRVFAGENELGPCGSSYWDEFEDYSLYNLGWIDDSAFEGVLQSDTSYLFELQFDTHGLMPGAYIVELEFKDVLSGKVVNMVETNLNIVAEDYFPPVNLQVQVNGQDVHLSWDPPSNGVQPFGYIVYKYNGSTITYLQPEDLHCDDENLDFGIYQYEVMALYDSGESIPAGPVSATITGTTSTQLQIVAGWSAISGYLQPSDPLLETIFADSPELEILYNNNGMFWPSGGVNTLIEWDEYSGYICKSAGENQINFTGYPIQNPVINLQQGWNLMPVLSDSPVLPQLLFGPEYSGLDILKEVAGTKLLWPEMGISSLETLEPGKAYLVKMNEALQISF